MHNLRPGCFGYFDVLDFDVRGSWFLDVHDLRCGRG
jgi:hypothetical protein